MKCYDIPLSLNMWSELHYTDQVGQEGERSEGGEDGVNWKVGVERLFGNFRGLD